MIYYVSSSDFTARKFSYDLQVDTYCYNYFTIRKILRRFLRLSFLVRLVIGSLMIEMKYAEVPFRSNMCLDLLHIYKSWKNVPIKIETKPRLKS